jgi:hypothetical protein
VAIAYPLHEHRAAASQTFLKNKAVVSFFRACARMTPALFGDTLARVPGNTNRQCNLSGLKPGQVDQSPGIFSALAKSSGIPAGRSSPAPGGDLCLTVCMDNASGTTSIRAVLQHSHVSEAVEWFGTGGSWCRVKPAYAVYLQARLLLTGLRCNNSVV